MPTQSHDLALPAEPAPHPADLSHPLSGQSSNIKCSLCGVASLAAPSRNATNEVVVLSDPIERICGGCVRAAEVARRGRDGEHDQVQQIEDALGLGLRGVSLDSAMCNVRSRESSVSSTSAEREGIDPSPPPGRGEVAIHPPPAAPVRAVSFEPSSLPARPPRPWTTTSTHSSSAISTIPESRPISPPPFIDPARAAAHIATQPAVAPNDPVTEGASGRHASVPRSPSLPNPLLDVSRARIPSLARGALYPGATFRGTQTSGRSAYDVQVQFADVNFNTSLLSGFLSISHLTDAHPHLTTFFTAEIIGPEFGFITDQRYGATEHDDMRHWGRFEQFRRPSTRADMIRPELTLRDPLPDRSKGEVVARERDFCFLRIKERFLVPDHKVKDISGASFAGFYYAMVDLAPTMPEPDLAPVPTSPIIPTSRPPLSPTSPIARRSSSSNIRSPSVGTNEPSRRRRESSSSKIPHCAPMVRGEATIRGYYFHSLNQEPFQELFLTHAPARGDSTMEMR